MAAHTGPPGLKLLVVGPSKSHKSAVCSFLAGLTDAVGEGPGPTVGVRILEVEQRGVTIELWDVSGDQQYEAGWPAIQKDADGVVFVFSPEIAGAAREVELWAEWFQAKAGVPGDRCVCLCLSNSAGSAPATPSLGPISVELHNLENDATLKKSFDRFSTKLASLGPLRRRR